MPRTTKPKAKKAKKAAAPRKPGRPCLYSPELLAEIVNQLTAGVPLAEVCRQPGMPDPSTVWDWEHREDIGKHVSQAIARARAHGADAIAADALRISDTPAPGVIEKFERVKVQDPSAPDGVRFELQVVERKVEDNVARDRLRVDTRLKLLAKWDPRYRDRVGLDHAVSGESLADLLRARKAARLKAPA